MANFENITIEKGMYQTKGGLSAALEKLDPSENYIGTSLEGLDAFSRQLLPELKLRRAFPRICEQSGSSGYGARRYFAQHRGDRHRH